MTYGGEKERIVKESIKAKRIIPTHIMPNSSRTLLEQIDKEYPEALVFYEKMQTIVVSSPLTGIIVLTGEEEEGEGGQDDLITCPCLGTTLLLSFLGLGLTFKKMGKNH